MYIYIYSSVFSVDATAPLADPTHMEIDISVWIYIYIYIDVCVCVCVYLSIYIYIFTAPSSMWTLPRRSPTPHTWRSTSRYGVVKCLWEVFVWGFGVLFLSRVCLCRGCCSLSVCVCDLLICLPRRRPLHGVLSLFCVCVGGVVLCRCVCVTCWCFYLVSSMCNSSESETILFMFYLSCRTFRCATPTASATCSYTQSSSDALQAQNYIVKLDLIPDLQAGVAQ